MYVTVVRTFNALFLRENFFSKKSRIFSTVLILNQLRICITQIILPLVRITKQKSLKFYFSIAGNNS